MSRPRTITVKNCFDVEVVGKDAGVFMLVFNGDNYRVRVPLGRHYLASIARGLWNWFKKDRAHVMSDLNYTERALKGDLDNG